MNFYLSKKTIITIIAIIAIIPAILIAYFAYMDEIKAIVDDWKANIVVAIMSVVIAGSILWATVRQGIQNRKHDEISVRPLLTTRTFTSRRDNSMSASIELVNCGFGPALITSVVLFLNDKKLPQEYFEFTQENLKKFETRRVAPLERGVIIKAKENYLMASVEYVFEKNNLDFIKNIDIKIEYQSIYKGETFIYDSRIEHDKTGQDSPQ